MQKGGSCRFSTPMAQTGGSNGAFLDKSLKKGKLRRLSSVGILSEMDKVSHSMATTSASKKAKLPEKSLNHCNGINYASTPRRRRSALEKRKHESQKPCTPTTFPDSRTEMDDGYGRRIRSKDCTKKYKNTMNEYIDSKQPLITKDEEEAVQALFALAQTFTDTRLHKPAEVEPSAMQTVPPNGMNMSQKKCLVHVRVCHFIKALQTTESENATFLTNPQKINHENHYSSGCNDHLPTTTLEQEMPFLDTMEDHQSQWSTMFKQQRYLGCYQNWQNKRHDVVGLGLSRPLIDVFGSKDDLNSQKWDSKGDLCFVPMLELTL